MQNFAKFVDVYHSSKGFGVWDTGLGHVDVWLNGGLEPTVAGQKAPGAHHRLIKLTLAARERFKYYH